MAAATADQPFISSGTGSVIFVSVRWTIELYIELGAETVKRFVSECIVSIADVTVMLHQISALVQAGYLEAVNRLLPEYQIYLLSDVLKKITYYMLRSRKCRQLLITRPKLNALGGMRQQILSLGM